VWERVNVNPETGVSADVIQSVEKNKIALKGPLATPIGKGHTSLNLALRKQFNLFANVRPCHSIQVSSNISPTLAQTLWI
jgi:isocitrate dehydrogenase (NAD+)